MLPELSWAEVLRPRRRGRRASAARSAPSGSCASARPGCARTCSSRSALRSSRSSPRTRGPTSTSRPRNGITYDPTRIAAQIVTGIGFLGAGAIIRQGLSVRGLTTAASLWVVAAIGMASGAGYYSGAVITTVVVLVSLWPLRIIDLPDLRAHPARPSSGSRWSCARTRARRVLLERSSRAASPCGRSRSRTHATVGGWCSTFASPTVSPRR